MADESTYVLISDLLPIIWESALHYMQASFVMPSLVTLFTDQTGMVDRKVSEYVETGVTDNLAETVDLTPTEYDRNLLSTLTPKEIGKQYLITDRRVESDTEGVMVDAARDLGYSIGKKVEQDLLGEFANLTGGIFGSEGTAMSMAALYNGRARMEANDVPGPYYAVMHPYQYLDIFNDFTNLSSPAPLDIRNRAQQSYYVTQVADFQIIVSSLVPKTVVQNEQQTITVTGTPTGGTFTLKFGEQETAAIAYDATAAAVLAALEALPNIGVGELAASGGDLPDVAVTIEWDGPILAGENVPLLALSVNSLTGGSSPDVALAVVQEGQNYAQGAIFSRDAMAFDIRRGFRLEPDRDPSLRATELNATMIYAKGGWRPTHGVILKSDASLPLA